MNTVHPRLLLISLAALLAVPLHAQVASWINDASFTAPAGDLASVAKQPLPENMLKGADPHALSNDPDQLQAELQALFGIRPHASIRETLAADRALVAADPKDAAARIVLTYVLLDAGIGDKARAEALEATVLAPKSAAAFSALGWASEFNIIDVRFGRGFDWQGAIAAWQKAKALNPKDTDAHLQLIDLYEHDANGFRYSSASRLADAIRELRELQQLDKSLATQYEDHLRIDQIYAHQLQDAHPTAAELISLRLYSQAADVLTAANAITPQQAERLRALHPYVPADIPANDPRAVIQQMIIAELTGAFDERAATQMLAHQAYPTEAIWQRSLQRNLAANGALQMQWKKSGVSPDVLTDFSLANLKLTATGNDATGYRISMQRGPGPALQTFFVVKEDGSYRIAATSRTDPEAGAEAIYLLRSGNEAAARNLLNWKLAQGRGGRGAGRQGGAADAETAVGPGAEDITLAAASLLVGRSDIQPLLPQIAALRERAPADQQPALDMLLARGYLYVGDGANAAIITRRMRAANPNNEAMENLVAQADALTHDFADWKSILAAQMQRRPNNRALIEASAKEAETEGDFTAARNDLKQIIDSGQAVTTDYNLYGWLALFSSPVAADAIPNSLQANSMSNNANFSSLHTLACLYSVTGKPAEARQVILHGMDINNLAEPNDAVWMVMGGIYEQYGATEAAIAAYTNVVRPDKQPDPTESYVLAQRRLHVLGAAH